MPARSDDGSTPKKHPTTVERASDRELVVTRWIAGPPHLVFEAWTKPELFQRWWVPKSLGLALLRCDLDVRVGGKYRLEFRFGDAETMAFFGTYLEVVPAARLVWTNEEQGDAGQVTTVTFTERDGGTLVTMRERFPTKEALEAARASGAYDGLAETFDQLSALLVGQATQPRRR